MASTADAQNRLGASLKTGTGSFSQVVAVTQGAINTGLLLLFNTTPELAKIDITSRNGQMKGELSTGKLSLPVDGNNLGTVYYYCSFESGSLKLWDDDLNNWTDSIDMAKWVFVFAVDIGKINLPKDSSEYAAAKEVINQPGDYSISRLYLDFNTHQIANFNEKLSSFNGRKWKNSSEKNYFVSLMLKWGDAETSVIGVPKNTTLAYAAATDKPESVNSQAPTFPPTSLIFQRYNYIAPESENDEPHGGLDREGDRNMLLYLEMTDNQPFPRERLLTNSGNFATSDMSGTMVISKANFWNNFLLRAPQTGLQQLLRMFNEITFAWCRGVSIVYDGFTVEGDADNGVGPGSGLDTDKDFYAWDEDGDLAWKWSKADYKKADRGSAGFYDGTMECWCDTKNSLAITAGSNLARISGTTTIRGKLNTHSAGIGEGWEASATMTWGLNITLKSVREGGMEISLNIQTDTDTSKKTFQISTYHHSWPLEIHNGQAKKLQDYFSTSISNAPFTQTEKTLQTALKSTARFILPGAKTFFYKNPIFNKHGDVLLQLEYDGAS